MKYESKLLNIVQLYYLDILRGAEVASRITWFSNYAAMDIQQNFFITSEHFRGLT